MMRKSELSFLCQEFFPCLILHIKHKIDEIRNDKAGLQSSHIGDSDRTTWISTPEQNMIYMYKLISASWIL